MRKLSLYILFVAAIFQQSCLKGSSSAPEAASSASTATLVVNGVTIGDETSESKVTVEASSEPKYNVFKLSDPDRVVVDLIDAKLNESVPATIAGSGAVKEIHVQALEDSLSALVRLEIYLASAANYLAGLEDKGLVIRLMKSGAEPSEHKEAPMADATPIAPVVPLPVPEAPTEAVAPVPPAAPELKADSTPVPPPTAEPLPLAPVPVPEAMPELKAEEKMAPSVEAPAAEAPVAEAPPVAIPAPLPEHKSDSHKAEIPSRPQTQDIPSSGLAEGTSVLNDLDTKIYTGKRISLEFQDADVQDVIRLIAEVSKLNIITAEDVKGKITLKLIDVPWDQALDIILTTLGLDKVQHGNILRVAPVEKLKKEREIALANDKAAKQLEPLKTKLINVNYATADEMAGRIKNMLSERGSVDTDTRTNTIIVKDIQENLSRAENLMKALDTQTPQVRIESRIVQATDNFTRSMGIQWGPVLNLTGTKARGIQFPRTIEVGGSPEAANLSSDFTTGFSAPSAATLSGFAVDALPGSTGSDLGIRLGSVSSIFNLDLHLSYAEYEDTARIVSRPSISVLDNRSARIIQGTKIPYLSSGQNGSNVQFQEAGIEISVTPHITSDGSVILKVSTKSNEPGSVGPGGNNNVLIREANTEMLVKSGRTAVLGGVFKMGETGNQSGVPFLKDIPILGYLFKGKQTQKNREETLIFITPYIISDARDALTTTPSESNLEP